MRNLIFILLTFVALSAQAQTKQDTVPPFAVDTTIGSMRHVVIANDTITIVIPVTHYILVDGMVVRQDPYKLMITDPVVMSEIQAIIQKKCYVEVQKEIRNIVVDKIIPKPQKK